MPYFQIHGHPGCPNYGHALVVARYLSKHLPNFQYRNVEVAPRDWGEHLMEINAENKWYLTKSPAIWKEVHQWGGKKYLIGGLGEFWEYIYSYYGLESRIPRSDLQKLAAENLKIFEEKEHEDAERIKHVRVISIIGASNLITILLLHELFVVPNLKKRDGIVVKLYDECAYDERKYKVMEDTANYYNSECLFGSNKTVIIVNTMRDLLEDCNVLIILEDFKQCESETNYLEPTPFYFDTNHLHIPYKCRTCMALLCLRQPGQQESFCLEKGFARMNYLSDDMTSDKHHHMRIIIANQGPSCFLATCIIELCPSVRPVDVVVVSADEGLSYINTLSEKTGIPVSKISGPPVWGFMGMYSFVDERHTMFKTDVYRPNAGSLTAARGSTLPLGTIKSELRLMSYLIDDHQRETAKVVDKKREKMMRVLERPAVYAKIRATISLLKLWYADPVPTDIISLGVCSNGSFDIPPGVVFSQPVMLDSKRRWIPYSEFPLMDNVTKKKIADCVEPTIQILKGFNLLHHFCREDDICSNPDCPMIIVPEG